MPFIKPDFQALFEATPGLYLALLPNSPTFTIIAVSNSYLQATMTKRNEIIGKGIFEAFPDNPHDPQATGVRNLRTSLERVVLSKAFDVMTVQKYDIARPDGKGFEERFWSPTNSPVLSENKEIVYIIHRVEDVTELVHLKRKGLEQEKTREELTQELQRKELEVFSRAKEFKEAQSSGQLARIILDRMYQFVGLFDADGRFLEINKPALDGSGLQKSDILGAYLWEVSPWKVSEENPKKVHNTFLKATKGEFVREELELWAGAGGTQKITIDFSLIPIRDDQGRIAYYLGEGRNITEKKQAEAEVERKNIQLNQLNERLKQLDQLKTQFFANVSHELRTPLTLILGPAEKLMDESNIVPQQKRELEVIVRNGRLLLKHVNDLLDVARLEAGKITPSYVKFNLGTVIKSIAAIFEGLARDKNIDFSLEMMGSLIISADPNMIQRVVLNLLSNAFKFTPSGGRICILVAQHNEEIIVNVHDTGQGVALELRNAIFERFKQGEDPMTKSFAGTGLGLAIAKEFVELHQGSIQVVGDPGEGAQFTVKLPIKAPAHIIITEETETFMPLNQVAQSLAEFKSDNKGAMRIHKQDAKGSVLIVEDNADLSSFLADILSADFNIETASDGQEGLQKAIALKPDLILSDIMMPRMSGDQMVAEIRKINALNNIPIMLLTAKADEQLRISLLKGGAQDYVLKPFFSEEVLARVKNLVAIKRSKEYLQEELESTEKDLQTLTMEVSQNRRQLKLRAAELERLNIVLQDSIQVRDEFLSIASHELKTPVSALKLQLQMVDRKIKPQENEAPSVEVLKKSFDVSLKQVDKFIDLINNLLDVSRIRLGRMVLQPACFDLSPVMKETFESFSAQFAAAKCPAQLLMDESIDVEWDKIRIQEILANLFTNAIKYAAGKPLKVSVNQSLNHTVKIIVEDQGPGIALGSQDKIFERFGQNLPSTQSRGMGLGLFIVKNLVEAHDGSIHLESDRGKGARFIVEIPMKPEILKLKS